MNSEEKIYGGRKRSCYGCEKRKVGCHATCEDYLEEYNQRQYMMKQRQTEIMLDNYKSDAAIRVRGKKPGFRLPKKDKS